MEIWRFLKQLPFYCVLLIKITFCCKSKWSVWSLGTFSTIRIWRFRMEKCSYGEEAIFSRGLKNWKNQDWGPNSDFWGVVFIRKWYSNIFWRFPPLFRLNFNIHSFVFALKSTPNWGKIIESVFWYKIHHFYPLWGPIVNCFFPTLHNVMYKDVIHVIVHGSATSAFCEKALWKY